jgi:hypothetical protein
LAEFYTCTTFLCLAHRQDYRAPGRAAEHQVIEKNMAWLRFRAC